MGGVGLQCSAPMMVRKGGSQGLVEPSAGWLAEKRQGCGEVDLILGQLVCRLRLVVKLDLWSKVRPAIAGASTEAVDRKCHRRVASRVPMLPFGVVDHELDPPGRGGIFSAPDVVDVFGKQLPLSPGTQLPGRIGGLDVPAG